MGQVLAYTDAESHTSVTLGQTLCTVSVLPNNAYACAFQAYYSGTAPGSIDQDNIALQSDPVTAGIFVTAFVLLQQPIINAPLVINHFPVWAQTTIKLIAIAAGTVGTVYHTDLAVAVPGPAGAFV